MKYRFPIALLIALGSSSAQAQDGKVQQISPALCAEMKSHNVMRSISPVGCERLKLVIFPYFGFDGTVHDNGQIVVMDAVADSVLRIFVNLKDMRFPIAKARLMNDYDGNDSASTADNNTSSFNARQSTGGSSLSMHAYGLAIDLNPVQNPYVIIRENSTRRIAPQQGAVFANRSVIRPGMAESVIDVFAEQGFTIWGGRWKNPMDYQHFQVTRLLADRLATMTPARALATFNRYVQRYRDCRKHIDSLAAQMACADRL